ncbi:MAG: hypothetical protein U7126_06450, partial [Microcoleus sp.]
MITRHMIKFLVGFGLRIVWILLSHNRVNGRRDRIILLYYGFLTLTYLWQQFIAVLRSSIERISPTLSERNIKFLLMQILD